MNDIRGHILWVDDEIDHLKPHIMYLEDKGYMITTTTNGYDAVELVKRTRFDLILMDQFMPGLDGMETLRRIKEIRDSIPIILITKSEEEWLMDEAISERIEGFLVKPVKPTQIFITAKKILESTKILEEKATSGYLKEFQEIEFKLQDSLTVDDWWKLYNRLVKWQLEFDEHKDTGLGNILTEQLQTSNREFLHFINSHYTDWLASEDRPRMTVDLIPDSVIPHLKQGEKTCFILVDSMRQDHLMTILPELQKYFDVDVDYALSILPTATAFSRNAIFSGLFPDDILKKYPQQRKDMEQHAASLNQHEKDMLTDQLKRHGLSNKSLHYHKIWHVDEGRKFAQRMTEFMKVDLLSIVINFVDILAHKRSESDVLKEMLPDESGYRSAVKTWFENSWFFDVLKQLSQSNYKVILASDHGSIKVHRSVLVGADKGTSSGVRYKYGRNLNCKERYALVVKRPKDYRLPEFGPQTNYLIAKDDIFFVYPTQQHRYETLYKSSFQHGGISLEEMFVPIVTMSSR